MENLGNNKLNEKKKKEISEKKFCEYLTLL